GLPTWPADLTLVIVGDGAKRQAVVDACAANNRIRYMGQIPYRDVPGVMAQARLGLSPQTNVDGRADTGLYPLKVFETLACAVPVIVTDFPGQADLVRKYRCGLVIPAADSAA